MMLCGEGVAVCGVLALMTGLGSGAQNVSGGAIYGHPRPVVHGLWPETPPYGTSQCLLPSRPQGPKHIYSCFACVAGDDNCTASHQDAFQQHEWSKHGRCAAAPDADHYFLRLCELARWPLANLTAARREGATELKQFEVILQRAGYEVFATMKEGSQLLLSACADASGRWWLAPQAQFTHVCGRGGARGLGAPGPEK